MKFRILLACLVLPMGIFAQELRCEVTINSNQIAQVEKSIFEAMQKGILELMNNTRWTDDNYKEEEKIKCRVFINVTEQEKDGSGQPIADRYKGTILIQSFRPVFNTNQESTILNYQDENFTFSYIPFQQMFYSQNSVQSNLTQVLAFYAMIIIGLDRDTYSEKGGDQYLTEAQQIVNNAQSLADYGWKSNEGTRNRYWMINDYLNSAFEPLRLLMYEYHRKGLDVWYPRLEEGRTQIATSLKTLDQVWTQRPNAFILAVFMTAKRNEIVDLFKPAPPNAKADLVPVLKKVDPSYASKYDDMNRSN